MDIKSSLEKYSMTTGLKTGVISTHPEPAVGRIEGGEKSYRSGTDILITNIQKSIKNLKISESELKLTFA